MTLTVCVFFICERNEEYLVNGLQGIGLRFTYSQSLQCRKVIRLNGINH